MTYRADTDQAPPSPWAERMLERIREKCWPVDDDQPVSAARRHVEELTDLRRDRAKDPP